MKKIYVIIFATVMLPITTGAGYVGTLPDIDSEFLYLKKDASENFSAPFSVEELDKQNEKKLKPIPRDDDDYIDIIVKKDKTSAYINDVNSIIKIMEKLRTCINTGGDIQKFNAISSNLIDHIAYLREEYKAKPESNYLSYNKLMQLSSKTAQTAQLRTKYIALRGYIPASSEGNIYTKENVQRQIDELLATITETVYILKNLE